MVMWSKSIKKALVSVLLLGIASAASAQIVATSTGSIVNVNAFLNGADGDAPGLNTPVTVNLAAGKYRLEFVDPNTRGGANYTSWNAWGRVGNCDESGQCTDNGWLNFVRYDTGSGAEARILGDFTIWSTPALSFAHAKTLPEHVFVKKTSGPLRFFIADAFHKDNLGGVSVRITPVTDGCTDPRLCECESPDACLCHPIDLLPLAP